MHAFVLSLATWPTPVIDAGRRRRRPGRLPRARRAWGRQLLLTSPTAQLDSDSGECRTSPVMPSRSIKRREVVGTIVSMEDARAFSDRPAPRARAQHAPSPVSRTNLVRAPQAAPISWIRPPSPLLPNSPEAQADVVRLDEVHAAILSKFATLSPSSNRGLVLTALLSVGFPGGGAWRQRRPYPIAIVGDRRRTAKQAVVEFLSPASRAKAARGLCRAGRAHRPPSTMMGRCGAKSRCLSQGASALDRIKGTRTSAPPNGKEREPFKAALEGTYWRACSAFGEKGILEILALPTRA